MPCNGQTAAQPRSSWRYTGAPRRRRSIGKCSGRIWPRRDGRMARRRYPVSAKARKRRSPGEGGCWSYQTKAGERFRVKGTVRLPDGTPREVNKRGFMTKTAGLEWLADAQSAGRKGDFIESSKQKFGTYGAEVIDGLRIGPQTKASYKKNWRLHIEAYPIAAVPLAQLTGLRFTTHYRLLEKSGR